MKTAKRLQKAKTNKKFKILTGSLGPVENLEEHVRPDWWRLIFNSLYLKTDGDVVDDQDITKDEVDLFVDVMGLSKENKILDLCCGQGRHSLEMARRGFENVEGLDRSHYLIQKARTKAKDENILIKFKEGDARKMFYPVDNFDVVMIPGNSFGYFENLKDDIKVLKEVLRVLKPWGKILIDIADGDFIRNNFQPRSWEWLDKKYFVCRERSLSIDKQRLISREVIVHVEKGVIADQFYAERLYSLKYLKELLQSAGFSKIKHHTNISPNSKRNQDLGMMENRLIVTGVAKKEWTKIYKRKSLPEKNIIVLLGDPKITDIIKPSKIFDDDDFETIDKMKDALSNINNYNFVYINNHLNLIKELEKYKGKKDYVLNFCDEGYMNDPKSELHVPAILEAMGYNYTGSGPQCLAHCYDKSLVRGIAKEMNIKVPQALLIKTEDISFNLPFDFPVIVKPNYGDSSFGITQKSVANNSEELVNAISEIRQKFGYDKPILVEQFLTGKDLSVGIIGNPPESYFVLPIIEEDYSSLPVELPRICGYEAKWDPKSPYWKVKSVRAKISEKNEKLLIKLSAALFERLNCRDYSRFDWRLDNKNEPCLLEVNPNPGWCWDGHLAKMAKLSNLSYSQFLNEIIKAAEQRFETGKNTEN